MLTALALVAATAVAGGAVLLVGGGSDGPPTQTGPDLPPGPAVLAPEDAPGAARLPGGTEPYTGVDPLTGDSFEIRLPPGLRSPAASRPKDVLFSTSIKGYGFLGLARVDRVPSARALVDSGDPEITAESVIRPSAVRDLPAWSREMPLRSGPARAFVFEHEGHVYQLDMVPGPAVTEAGTDSALAAVQTFRWTS